ncbi:MAG: hypothetical protein ACTSVI_15060 [Promethearchaeota archaeon]
MDGFNLAQRGSAKDFSTKKIGKMVVTMLYPAILSHCYTKLGKEGAIQALKKMGEKIADDYLKIYSMNKHTFQENIKDFFKIFYDSKVKIKKIDANRYDVVDNDCILCSDITVEGLPFHYCTAYSGSIQRVLEFLKSEGKISVEHDYEVETIASKGSGDKACIHSIVLKEVK